MSNRTKVFISYSHKDEVWLNRLTDHLRPLERDYGIDIWHDKKLRAGSKWREEIAEAVGSAKVAVLLVSASFLASDFITTDELPPLLNAAEKEGATVIPVIISACRFSRIESLSKFQAVNHPSDALIDLPPGKQEKVLEDVAYAIEASLPPPTKTHASSSEEDSSRGTFPPALEDDDSTAKEDSHFVLIRFYKRHRPALIIGTVVIFVLMAVWLARMYGKLPAEKLPGVLVLSGIIVAVFVWLPFRISVKWFTLAPPRQLSYRLLIFVLGVLILASGVYLSALTKQTVSEPTLRSYFAYISLEPLPTSTTSPNPTDSPTSADYPTSKDPPNCRVIYHVALRFEVPEGQLAVYKDRIKSGGGGTALDSNPSHTPLKLNQWPGNPTLLEFKIEEKHQPSRFLDIEAAAFLHTRVTREYAKIGPHLPYRTEFVVVIVDYSRMNFDPAPSDIRGQIEFLGPGGEGQTEPLSPVYHPQVKDGTVTLVGRNLPAESHILVRWGENKQ